MASELKKSFKDNLDKFLDNCIPLSIKENSIYFLSETSQLYGFDYGKNILFEPSTINKYNLINTAMTSYFNDEVKKTLETKYNLKFDDLIEMNLKTNYREKYIGRKFFFSKNDKKIFIWSMVTTKWEKSDIDSIRYIFANNEILTDPGMIKLSEKAKSLDDLGIDFNDLEEIKRRLRDGCIHYYHRKTNKVYSLNIPINVWYGPNDLVQKELGHYGQTENTDTSN